MKKKQTDINIEKESSKYICKQISKPIIYKPSDYKISDQYTGREVKQVIIDSGSPRHKDIKIQGEKISFCENDKNEYDKAGHSTIVSGIIAANNKNTIKGLAPYVRIHYAKVIDNSGKCNFNSLVAAILWAVVKKADIIMMALGTQCNYDVLHSAIKKAFQSNICIIASAGKLSKDNEIDFPARYEEVFAVSSLTRSKKKNEILQQKAGCCLPNTRKMTTFLDNSYIKVAGDSMATSIVTAVACLLIEKHKLSNQSYVNSGVYSEIIRYFKS